MPRHGSPSVRALSPRRRVARPRSLLGAAVLVIAATLSACGATIPVVSFDPTSACTTDGREPGAYPDLEALLPRSYDGRAPDNVDSGRSCTKAALGSLAAAGIDAVRFAGATWTTSSTSGLTLALFEGDGLDAAKLLHFYAVGAQGDSHTERIATSDTTVGGKAGRRLDVLGTDGAGHTIVTWPADATGQVWVLLATDIGDTNVAKALAEFAGGPSGSPRAPSSAEPAPSA